MLSHELFCMVSQTGHQIGGVTVSQQPGRGDHQNDGQIILLQTYVYIHIIYIYTHTIYIYICNDACNNFATYYISQFWDGASMSRTLWLRLKPRGLQILRWLLRSRYFGMLCMTVRRGQLSRELEIRVI